MSVLTRPDGAATAAVRAHAIKPGLPVADLEKLLIERFAVVRDPLNPWDLAVLVPAARLREVLTFLRDEPALRFAMLLDVSGIDYLSFPGHTGPRYAVTYLMKSLEFRHRLAVKVQVDENAAAVPSVHDLFGSANWAERETWDQYGIDFTGHPNLKRLLNHHEFIGHPLRKDYPCQKRQKLSVSDPMVDQLTARLEAKGFTVVDMGDVHQGDPIAASPGAKA